MIEELDALLSLAEKPDVPPNARRSIIRAAESGSNYMDDGQRKRLERLRTSVKRDTDMLLKNGDR